MDTLFWLLVWIIIIVLVIRKFRSTGSKNGEASIWSTLSTEITKEHQEIVKLSPYAYGRKKYIMTSYEMKLFRRLETIARDKYYVFPQVHLSSLVDHKINNGQDWRAALSKIQRKSVDFVLVDKETLETAYAIELDDRTHDNSYSRWERDKLVDEILFDCRVPLVRLRNILSLSDEQIKSKIISAKQKIQVEKELIK